MQAPPTNGPQHASMKDSILSLYSAQPGHPSTGVYASSTLQLQQQQMFQQQQIALMKMQQQQAMVQQQASTLLTSLPPAAVLGRFCMPYSQKF